MLFAGTGLNIGTKWSALGAVTTMRAAMMRKEQLTIRLHDYERAALADAADLAQVTEAEFVRVAIVERLGRYEAPAQV